VRAALIAITLVDAALGVLLIAVSGFILEGVNNTGPMMPEAVLFVGLIALCFAAPAIAWTMRKRASAGVTIAIAVAPLVIAAIAVLAEPA
jgi:hypothetical protein